jgi:hypothetical protein
MDREKFERAKRYFINLARRAETNPDDAEFFSRFIGERLTKNWEPMLEAAIQADETLERSKVQPLIDAAIAKSLREKRNLSLIADLYNRLPQDSIQLKQTIVEVSRQTALGMEERKELFPAAYLTILSNFVMRLYQVGSLEEAKTNAEKALKYARELCKDRPDEFQNKLIDCLEAWAVVASGFGLLEECRQAREEAINLLLGQSFRDGEDKLAQCLNNLSGTLAALSDIAGAIRCSKKAVRLYRKLVRQRRSSTETNFRSGLQAFVDDLRPALADALTALSSHQREAARFRECLASAQEAYEIFYALKEDYPDQFLHHFAMAVHNLGQARIDVGDLQGGLHEIKEAAEIYKKLAEVHADSYNPAYAHILGSLALALVKNHELEAALAEMEQCVTLYRKLNRQTPGRFLRQFARNLDNLRLIYLETRQTHKAWLAADELKLLVGNPAQNQQGAEED